MTAEQLAGVVLFVVIGFFVWQLVRIGVWMEEREAIARRAEAAASGFCECGDCVDQRSNA